MMLPAKFCWKYRGPDVNMDVAANKQNKSQNQDAAKEFIAKFSKKKHTHRAKKKKTAL